MFGTIGIGLGAAAGAAINQIIDQRADAVMMRTSARPLPSRRLDTVSALAFAGLLAVVSTALLVVFVNTITAALTMASMVGDSVVYTVFLKRATPQNIVIGGAAGAIDRRCSAGPR